MTSETEKKGFWTTLPGIFTGLASIITALTGIWFAFNPGDKSDKTPTVIYQQPQAVADSCESNVWDNWKIIKSHAGEVTDAIDDVTRFLELAANYGCTGYTYTLRLNKQNIGAFVVTLHEPYPHNGYKYREVSHTLEVSGERRPTLTWLYRSQMNSDNWESVEK